jgi:hypothetical protein
MKIMAMKIMATSEGVQQACQTTVEWSIFNRTRELRAVTAIVRGPCDDQHPMNN